MHGAHHENAGNAGIMTGAGATVADRIIARLNGQAVDHPNFVGAPLDVSVLDAQELGRLWPALRRAEHAELEYSNPIALYLRELRAQFETLDIAPLLDETSALALFRDIPAGAWARALDDLPYLPWPLPATVRAELERILSQAEPEENWFHKVSIYGVWALEYFAGRRGQTPLRAPYAARYQDSPYTLRELDALEETGAAALLALSGNTSALAPKRLGLEHENALVTLAHEARYVEFAFDTMTKALQHINSIQRGDIPYVADRAFTIDDAQVIARAFRVAAYRDEPWLRPMIAPLLAGICIAPTAAKTVPSQSLAIALGHAIEWTPTPEGVQALRAVLTTVRHAGIEKKLARNLKPAERALGERPQTALRITRDAKPDKKMLSLLATCLESSYWNPITLDYAEWKQRLIDAPAGAAFSTLSIWHAQVADDAEGVACVFMPELSKGKLVFRDAAGHACVVDERARIRLWHPLLSDAAERAAWQRRILALKLKQPVRQAFREYYTPPPEDQAQDRTALFAGHVLKVRSLLGLARRESWAIREYDLIYDNSLMREFGAVRVRFGIENVRLYPGADGYGVSGQLTFERRADSDWTPPPIVENAGYRALAPQASRHWRPAPIGEIDPIVFSEIARAVDLLVSVSAFALDDTETRTETRADMTTAQSTAATLFARWPRLNQLATLPLGVMAQHRKAVLALLFAEQIAQGRVQLEERHLRIGDYAIHCATGRVTHKGEAIDAVFEPPPSPLSAVPWLPYDEALLQRIADIAAALLQAT